MGFSNNTLQIDLQYIIQQYFTVTAPNINAFTKYLKQTKYKMLDLVLVHKQSAENVRLRWGF